MLGSISEGATRIKNLLMADDCRRTIDAFRAMGVKIDVGARLPRPYESDVTIHGVGMHGLKKSAQSVYLGNSGTTMRILPGILAGQDFTVVLKGDRSLSKRPMRRIAGPLRKMGAEIVGADLCVRPNGPARRPAPTNVRLYPPLKIHGGKLKPIKYKSKIASAQVKSCILLAGLFAKGITSVTEPVKSRDHTERMLRIFGCRLKAQGCRVSLKGPARLKSPGIVEVPGDISSAAFFIVAGCILPAQKIIIKNVGLNPTRTGVLDILKRMGADITVFRRPYSVFRNEPSGDIIVKSSRGEVTSPLQGVTISAKQVVRAIDEIPVIMVAACFAKGTTVIKGIGELRVKETDRIRSMVTNLRRMGAEIDVGAGLPRPYSVREKEYIVIHGGRPLRGGRVSSYGDHRTAMSMLIAGLASKGKFTVTGLDCINKSFPNFLKTLKSLHSIRADT